MQVEWKALGKLIEEDRRVREVLKRKLENAQAEAKTEGTELTEGEHGLQDKTLSNFGYMKVSNGVDTPSRSFKIRRPEDWALGPLGWAVRAVQDKTDSITISMEKLQYYEDAFIKIQEATGIGGIITVVGDHVPHAAPYWLTDH